MEEWLKKFIDEAFVTDLNDPVDFYMKDPRGCFFIVEEISTGKMIGGVGLEYITYDKLKETKFAKMHSLPENSVVGELRRMAIDPAYHGRGIGKLLVLELLKFANEKNYNGIFLSTSSLQPNAQRLYQNVGFNKIGIVVSDLENDYHEIAYLHLLNKPTL